MSSPLPPKKDVALALLERSSVFVYLDPLREGVVTPVGFKKDPKLVLQVGLNMAVPIHDLNFDDAGLSCTLSFSRTPFFVIVPWHAIFALTDEAGQGIVWPDDVPRELMEAQQQAQRRAALRVVPNEEEPAAPAKLETPEPPAAVETVASSDKPKSPKKPKKTPADEALPPADASGKSPGKSPGKSVHATAKEARVKEPVAKKPAKKSVAGKPEKAEKREKAAAKKPAAAEKPTKASAEKAKKPAAKEALVAKDSSAKSPAKTPSKGVVPKAEPKQPGLFDSTPTPTQASKPAVVPPPIPSSPAASPAPQASPAPSTPTAPTAPAPQRFGKQRRELPPYLRVVK